MLNTDQGGGKANAHANVRMPRSVELCELHREIEATWRQRIRRSDEAGVLSVRNRTEDVYSCYRALWARGFKPMSRGFTAKHVPVLVKHMREELSRSTAKRRWSVLRSWVALIGKPGLVPMFEEVWPLAPDANNRQRPYRRLAGLTEQQYSDLLVDLNGRSTWTHALRLIKEVGLTKEEAFATDLRTAASRMSGYLLTEGKLNQKGRAVPIGFEPDPKALVVQEALAYLQSINRETLADSEDGAKSQRMGWRRSEVSIQRFDNAIAYRLNKRSVK